MSWDVVPVFESSARNPRSPVLRVGYSRLSFNAASCSLLPGLIACEFVQLLLGSFESRPVLGFRFYESYVDDSLKINKYFTKKGNLSHIDIFSSCFFREFFGDCIASKSFTYFDVFLSPDDPEVLCVFLGDSGGSKP